MKIDGDSFWLLVISSTNRYYWSESIKLCNYLISYCFSCGLIESVEVANVLDERFYPNGRIYFTGSEIIRSLLDRGVAGSYRGSSLKTEPRRMRI